MPSNGILCKANLYSDVTVTAEKRVAAAEDAELLSRFARLLCEFSSLDECM